MKPVPLLMILISCTIALASAQTVPSAPTVPTGQEQVRWMGPATVVAPPAVTVTVRIHCPDRATKAVWNVMPQGVRATAWQRDGDEFVSSITPAATLMPGTLRLSATVQGATWRREFEPVLSVIPALSVAADAYAPGERLVVRVVSKLPRPAEVLVQTRKTAGAVLPGVLKLEPGTETTLAFVPVEGVRGVVGLTFKLSDDVEQMHWLRPLAIDVPGAGRIEVDGDLRDWPAASRLDSRYFAGGTAGLPAEAHLAYSDAGLYVAARLAVRNLRPTDASSFATSTHLELSIDASGEKADGWSQSTRRFVFHPMKQADEWRLAAWDGKRGDPRCKTAIRVESDSTIFEAFIPGEALGARPVGAWRALLAVRIEDEGASVEGAWPRPRADVIDAPARWGVVRFGQ